MKKVFLLFAMLLMATPIFAQGTDAIDYSSIFTSFATLTAAIPFITEAVKRIANFKGIAVQIFSWVIGIALSFIAFALNIGFLADESWHTVLILGAASSLAANGVFDIGVITGVLALFGIKTKK